MQIVRWRILVATAALVLGPALGRAEPPRSYVQIPDVEGKDRHGAFTLGGDYVHDAGELQLNLTNWGLIGSHPSSQTPYSDSPSAMWPAGSGVDYLYAAGLWIGGVRNGVPLVSTGQYQNELIPTADPRDIIYESTQGAPGGHRYPFADEDDDGDGRADEDPLNGFDDDGDGRIDEDFAALSDQYFRLSMRDDLALTQEMYPDHQPLGVQVIQESLQWENRRLEDSVAFDVRVRNVGKDTIEFPVFGVFADGDIGVRSGASVSEDDMFGFWSGSVGVSDGTQISLSVAYMYDCDGDGGRAEGYIGFHFLGVRTVPDRRPAPTPVFIQSLRAFAGNSPFDRGGDPSTDAERYEALTGGFQRVFPSDCSDANDYRFLMAFRPPVSRLEPTQEVRFQWAISAGEDLDDLIQNAAEIALAYHGEWYDRDGRLESGFKGREKYVCAEDFGPPDARNPLFSMQRDCGRCLNPINGTFCPPIKKDDLDKNLCLWLNDDCDYEAFRGVVGLCFDERLGEPAEDYRGCTGISGQEHHEYWIAESPLPPPAMRLWERDHRVHLFWNDEPENAVDRDFGLPNFEAYKIWRADGWNRPPGTSIATGPGTEQWAAVAEFDVGSRYLEVIPPTSSGQQPRTEWLPLGPNTGLGPIRYTPLLVRPGTEQEARFAPLRQLIETVIAENPHLDEYSTIRGQDGQGIPTELGQRYPGLMDWACCPAEIDTLNWVLRGRGYYEYVDRRVQNGFYYFYSVTAATARWDTPLAPYEPVIVGLGVVGQPQRSFGFAVPQSPAQTPQERDLLGQDIYVVPNPVTQRSLAEFQPLQPNSSDPTGVRLEFRNLPAARNRVSIFTLAGDLVATLDHDGRDGRGSLPWNLVSRKGQEIVSGVYLYVVESDDPRFDRVIGRFVVVR